MVLSKKTLFRSSLVALFSTIEGMGLHAAKGRFILHEGPPRLDHLAAVAACYLAAGFAFALGFFHLSARLPGRTWLRKGLRYSVMVLLVIWISGLVAMCGIDFEGGWDLGSPAKIAYYWMALCDCLTWMTGGFVLALMARRDGPASPIAAPLTSNLAARVAAGAALLPLLCAPLFHLAALALPLGLDLRGTRGAVFDFFVFAPLAISGAGTALFHDLLRSGSPRAAGSEVGGAFRFVFVLYWVTSNAFIPFLGFTWQSLVDFLAAGAAALFLTIAALETIAGARPRTSAEAASS